MHSKNLVLFLILLICCSGSLPAQYISPDSLKKIIATTKSEREKIEAMSWLSYRLMQNKEIDSSQFWAEKAFNLSKAVNYKTGLGLGYINFGNLKYANGKHLEAIADYRKAIVEFEHSGHKGYLAVSYLNISLMLLVNEDFSESLQSIYKGLSIANQANYEPAIAQAHLLLGELNMEIEDFDGAYPYLNKAINLYQKQGEKLFLATAYWTLAMGKLGQQKYTEAISDFDDARITAMNLNSSSWFEPDYFRALGLMCTSLGDSLKKTGSHIAAGEKYKLAEKHFFTALEKDVEDDPYGRALVYNNLGLLYFASNRVDLAKIKFEKAIGIANSLRDKKLLRDSYYNLARIDSIKGNFKLAYMHLKKHLFYHNMLYNEQTIRKREQYKNEFEIEKKNDQIKLLSAENKLKTVLASKQKQQKNFAYAGIGLILLAGSYGFYRFRKRKQIQNQQVLSNERLRISSELHDEVGATLSGIAMYSHLAKEQIKNPHAGAIENSLSIIQSNAGEMVNKLNDIVWLINPGQDTLQKLVQRLEEYAGDMAAIKNMQVKITVPEIFSTHSLPVESRRNIYLFCKEAINNAVKYSEGSLLELTVKENKQLLEIIISDNGKGFDAENIKRGNGLNNMQNRATELGAALNLESTPGEGCSITLQVKITQ